jgi:hypothetical protein
MPTMIRYPMIQTSPIIDRTVNSWATMSAFGNKEVTNALTR